MADDAITFRLLGPLAAVRGSGEVVELGPPKQRATLALLLLNRGRVVSTDRLIDSVWGDAAPPSAVAGLQAYISNLRRILRTDARSASPIVRQAPGYILDVAAERLDVAGFEAAVGAAREAAEQERWPEALTLAEDALGRWRGELLADLADESWVRGEAESLEELRTEAHELRVTALLAVNRTSPALVAVQELRAADPLRDRGCWLHMLVLHRAGRTLDALELYRSHAARLSDELGLEPDPELRELEGAILRHDPALAAWPRTPAWTGATELPAPAVAPVEPTLPEPTLVGRERETAHIDATLAHVAAGRVRWLVLTGAAGIGKSRLAEELGARARARGGREAWARCAEEGAPSWWAVRQLLRALGEDPDVVLATPEGADADATRFVLYERVAAVLGSAAAAGRPPLVIVVDDVQWIDRTSALCLAFLAGVLREAPVAVALTLRDGEARDAADPLLAALARTEGYGQLPVGPLAATAVGELAARVAGRPLDADEVHALAARTGGNPLFVSEYARLDPEAGGAPLAVRAVMQRRLAGLQPELLDLLGVAAVLGDEIDLPLVAATAGLDLEAATDRLDEAADEHVVVPSAQTTGYAFAHGLLREEVLAGLRPSRRRGIHAQAAAALAGATDGDRVSRRAGHLVAALGAVEPATVLEGCRAAAHVAEGRFDFETAAGWWAAALRAFDSTPVAGAGEARDELLVAHVGALARGGRGQTALDVVEAELLQAARAGRTATVGALSSALLRSHGAWPWPWPMLRDATSVVELLAGLENVVAADPDAHVRWLAALGVGHAYTPDASVADAISLRAIALAEASGDPALETEAILGRLILRSGVAPAARESVARFERFLELPHTRADAAVARTVICLALLELGRVDAAREQARLAIAEADFERLPSVRVQLRWLEVELAILAGDFGEADRCMAIANQLHPKAEIFYRGSTLMAEGAYRRERGTLADAETDGIVEPVAWEARVAAARGDAATTERLASEWLATRGLWKWSTLGALALVGEALAEVGVTAGAREVLDALAPYSGAIAAMGHVSVIGSVDLIRARLLALLGETSQARTVLASALAHAETAGAGPTAARCRAALGALD